MANDSRFRAPRALWYIIAAAIAVRILFAIIAGTRGGIAQFTDSDTISYLTPARELIENGRFWGESTPEITRTPGYPLFLIPGILLGHVEYVTLALQMLLGGVAVYLVWLLARRVTDDERVALLAAGLYAIEPMTVLLTFQLMTETLSAVTFGLALLALHRYFAEPRARMAVVFALMLAASSYVRPVFMLIPPVLFASLLVWIAIDRTDARRRLVHGVVFAAAFVAALAPWVIRNHVVADYNGFCAATESDLYFVHAGGIIGMREGRPPRAVGDSLGYNDWAIYLRNHPDLANATLGARYRAAGKEGAAIILQEPVLFAKMWIDGVARVLFAPGSGVIRRIFVLYPDERPEAINDRLALTGIVGSTWIIFTERPGLFLLGIGITGFGILLYLFTVASLFLRRIVTSPTAIAFLVMAAYLVVVAGGEHGYSRYRHPVMLILCPLAAQGIVASVAWWRERRRRGRPEAVPAAG